VPTFEANEPFLDDYDHLTDERRAAFKAAVRKFVHDLRAGQFRKGLRVKRVVGRDGVWELTWADDGRATFSYGDPVVPGDAHIIWRRVGTHDIFDEP